MQRGGELAPGTVFAGAFHVERWLAGGGMGDVYVVTQLKTNYRRALKVIRDQLAADRVFVERFEREARVGAEMKSEHVIQVMDAGVDAETGMPWMLMELLEGADLQQIVAKRGPLELDMLAGVAAQAGHALAAAHRIGVIHRDLKPENLFLAQSHRADVPFTLKVLDFGIAKCIQDAGAGQSTRIIGSPMWMAPEQTKPGARIGPETDIWALGLIVFYLLTGRLYWLALHSAPKDIVALLKEILKEPIVPPSLRARELGIERALPAGFDDWFACCVVRDADARAADAAALTAELARLVVAPAQSRRSATVAMSPAFLAQLHEDPPHSGLSPTVTDPRLAGARPVAERSGTVPMHPGNHDTGVALSLPDLTSLAANPNRSRKPRG